MNRNRTALKLALMLSIIAKTENQANEIIGMVNQLIEYKKIPENTIEEVKKEIESLMKNEEVFNLELDRLNFVMGAFQSMERNGVKI